MNSVWVKLGFLAAGAALGAAAVKLLESDKVIVIREEALSKVKDTAGQAVNAVKNTADQIKTAVADKLYRDDTIISFGGDEADFGAADEEKTEEQ